MLWSIRTWPVCVAACGLAAVSSRFRSPTPGCSYGLPDPIPVTGLRPGSSTDASEVADRMISAREKPDLDAHRVAEGTLVS
jgi:hypothetical protein